MEGGDGGGEGVSFLEPIRIHQENRTIRSRAIGTDYF